MFRARLRGALRSTRCEIREDISGCRRKVRLEAFPTDVKEAAAALRIAQDHRIKVHPVSCGRNWGFGSSLPACDHCMILNLSGMKRIRQLNTAQHVVEVEPGVTQGQMSDHLLAAGDSHFLNVTGAGLSTSLLGNALERGIGYFGSRDRDLIGAEVLLANGDLIRLGHERESGCRGASLGPSIEGLFVQSGWGILTAGTLILNRKSELMGGVILDIHEAARLPWLVNRLSCLVAEGWINGLPHIFDQIRLETTFGAVGNWPSWSAVVPVRGPRLLVSTMVAELRRQFSAYASVSTLNLGLPDEDVGPLSAIRPLLEGKPIDLALSSMAKTIRSEDDQKQTSRFNPETENAGLIHVTPSCAVDDLPTLLCLVKKTAAKHGWEKLPLSFNLVNARYGCLVISICFKRDSAIQKTAAKDFATNLLRNLALANFPPYRLGLEQGAELAPFQPALARLCRSLQAALDPNGVLAPSRYDSLWHPFAHQISPDSSSLVEMIERQQLRTKGSSCAENVASS